MGFFLTETWRGSLLGKGLKSLKLRPRRRALHRGGRSSMSPPYRSPALCPRASLLYSFSPPVSAVIVSFPTVCRAQRHVAQLLRKEEGQRPGLLRRRDSRKSVTLGTPADRVQDAPAPLAGIPAASEQGGRPIPSAPFAKTQQRRPKAGPALGPAGPSKLWAQFRVSARVTRAPLRPLTLGNPVPSDRRGLAKGAKQGVDQLGTPKSRVGTVGAIRPPPSPIRP